ncbi:hypothetical protein ACFQZZ_08070 [Nocardia sp. GCM10030253]|uniref:hypothetical protein n=1 Tax=Nocardia sp. GCM10030253 TaxID=3273404 RepID=UPI00362F98BB
MNVRTELEHELRGPLSTLDLLSDQEAADLLMLFRGARQRETDALSESIDMVVGSLPRPLRGPAKRIMFGDRRH